MLLFEALNYDFMQNALIISCLISVACGICGTLAIINKMTFVAGGVAHGAFGGIGIAIFLGLSPLFGGIVFAVFLGLLIGYMSLKNQERIDSIVGALWAFGIAIGLIFIDLKDGYKSDLFGYLFGSILAVSKEDIILTSVIDLLLIVFVFVFYKQICVISFEREFAFLRALKVRFLYLLMCVLLALCIIISVRAVGLILAIAFLTIPPFIAEKFSSSIYVMMIISACLGIIFCIFGLILSYLFDLTSGASIILIASFCFFVAHLLPKRLLE